MTPAQQAALGAWIAARLGLRGSPAIVPVAGGQSNPTYFVTQGGQEMVLRKQPSGPLLRGAHAIDREFRIQSALAMTGVPVPRMIAWCEDAELLGTPFYLMERVPGRVWHQTAMPGANPPERRAMYLSTARTLARLHSVRPQDVGLEDFGKPGNYFARQVSRWGRQWREARTRGIPELDDLEHWLVEHLPADDGLVSIAHGDFRIGNLLFAPDRPDVAAVLDWELSTLGHPLADVGFFCICWRAAQSEYGGLADIDWRQIGIPARDEFLAEYYAQVRHDARLAPFHEGFALFRFAVIFVGIADRALAGTAAGDAAGDAVNLARAFARHGLAAVAGGAANDDLEQGRGIEG